MSVLNLCSWNINHGDCIVGQPQQQGYLGPHLGQYILISSLLDVLKLPPSPHPPTIHFVYKLFVFKLSFGYDRVLNQKVRITQRTHFLERSSRNVFPVGILAFEKQNNISLKWMAGVTSKSETVSVELEDVATPDGAPNEVTWLLLWLEIQERDGYRKHFKHL